MTHCRQVEHRLSKHTHTRTHRGEKTSNASRHSFVFALLDAKGAQVELLPSPVRGEWANKSAGTGQTRRPKIIYIFAYLWVWLPLAAPKSNNVSQNHSNDSPDRSAARSVAVHGCLHSKSFCSNSLIFEYPE